MWSRSTLNLFFTHSLAKALTALPVGCGSSGFLLQTIRTLAAVICLAALAQAVSAQVQMWTIDSNLSQVRIQVGKEGLFSFAGHTHEVIAPAVAGEIRLDRQQPQAAEIRLEFDASALKVTGEGEPAEDVPEVQRTMLGEKVLDARRYPKIVFRSRRVDIRSREDPQIRLRVSGDLTLHGVTRPIEVPVDVKQSATNLTAVGRFTIKQTDFGIQPVSAGLGTVKVKDELTVQVMLAAKQQ